MSDIVLINEHYYWIKLPGIDDILVGQYIEEGLNPPWFFTAGDELVISRVTVLAEVTAMEEQDE
jgi:hypothetical protein